MASRRSLASAAAALALLVQSVPECIAQTPPPRVRPAEEAPEQYPAGAARDDTFYFCTACHSFKIVAAQGLSRERWNETLDFMVERHKMPEVKGAEREKMLDYLAAAFPERREPGGWKNPFAK